MLDMLAARKMNVDLSILKGDSRKYKSNKCTSEGNYTLNVFLETHTK